MTATRTKTNSNETAPDQAPEKESNETASDQAPEKVELYAVVFPTPGGARQVEIHTDHTAESFVSGLTLGSKQSRREAEKKGIEVPEGGGSHEIDRDQITVLRLAGSVVTDF